MTTIALTVDGGAPRLPAGRAGLAKSTVTVTRRALLRYVRTPQLIVMATIQMSMFFLIYRYLFGGAIHIAGLSYVDYLVPGFIATGVLFSGIGAAVATRPRTSSKGSSTGCAHFRSRAAACSPPER
jgi:ABC-2 type transporter